MKKYFIYVFLLILSACFSGKHGQYYEDAGVRKTYTRLINLLEKGTESGMSGELMREIFFVYNDKLLSESGPNFLNPFTECVKIHCDVSVIMKKAPIGVLRNFEDIQEDFLRELHMLKTCGIADKDTAATRLTAARLIEASYLKFLFLQFAQNKDFYDRRLAEAIVADAFTPATAMALYLKAFGMSSRKLVESPKIYVIRPQNIPGKILLISSAGCCRTVFVKSCYVDDVTGQIHKISFPKNFKSKCVNVEKSYKVVIYAAENKFYDWNDRDLLISFHGDCKEDSTETVSFGFDYKNMQWIEFAGKKG